MDIEDGEIELPENQESLWVGAGVFSVRIRHVCDGINVEVYAKGFEDLRAVNEGAETFLNDLVAPYHEAAEEDRP